jgi:transcriptional antiterminator RfaH
LNKSQPDTELRWHVVRVCPKQEERANANLLAWGLETFNPKARERRLHPFTDAPYYVTKPLFPGYIFARFNTETMLGKVCYTRGVQTVISFGGRPTPVDDDIIELLRLNVDENGLIRIGEGFRQGDKVRIRGGAFDSLVGIFEREIKSTERVVILFETLRYQGHVEVERRLVEKVS